MTAKMPIHFLSLEGGRFIAALFVALFHIETAIRKFYPNYLGVDIFRAGHAGVEYFFVLSGFIMYWVHCKDVGKLNKAIPFLEKRAIRILPMYWIAFFAMLIGILLFPTLQQGREITFYNCLLDILLLPRDGEMILAVAWTLRQELIFYIIFCLSIAIPRIGWCPLFCWQVLIVGNLLGLFSALNPWASVILDVKNLGFGLGVLVAHCVNTRPARYPVIYLCMGIFLLITLIFAEYWMGGDIAYVEPSLGQITSSLLYIGIAAIIIFNIASFEITFPFNNHIALNLLGGSSYVLYLFHGLITSTAIRIITYLAPGLSPAITFFLLISFVIVGAILIHVLIERPVLKTLRRNILTRKVKTVS